MTFNEDNQMQRLQFVDLWAKYVLEHEDREWSRQQNIIINSCLKNSSMTKEQYLEMKGEKSEEIKSRKQAKL